MEFVEELKDMKFNATIYHIGDGYHYLSSHCDRTRTYLSCVHRKKSGCPGRASIPAVKEKRTIANFHLKRKHNCTPDIYYLEVALLRAKILKRCSTEVTDCSKIFYEETSKVSKEVRSRLGGFEKLSRSMRRCKDNLEKQTTVPGSLREYGEFLAKNDGYDTLYHGGRFFLESVVGSDGYISAIFASPMLCKYLPTVQEIQVDVSFKLVPKRPPTTKLMTIMAMYYDHMFPVIFVLMEKSTLASYDAVFNFVKEKFPDLKPTTAITDYEVSLQESIKANFPDTNVTGCWYHLANSMNRKVKRLGDTQLIEENSKAFRVFKMCQALPLLPADKIEDGYNFVVSFAQHHGLLERLKIFLSYVYRVWIEGVGAEALSVFDQKLRTNNDLESYHWQLKHRLQESHQNIFKFTEALLKIEASYVQKCSSLAQTPQSVRERMRGSFILSNNTIALQSAQLIKHNKTGEFLYAVSKHLDDTHNHSNNVPDSDESDEENVGAFSKNSQLPSILYPTLLYGGYHTEIDKEQSPDNLHCAVEGEGTCPVKMEIEGNASSFHEAESRVVLKSEPVDAVDEDSSLIKEEYKEQVSLFPLNQHTDYTEVPQFEAKFLVDTFDSSPADPKIHNLVNTSGPEINVGSTSIPKEKQFDLVDFSAIECERVDISSIEEKSYKDLVQKTHTCDTCNKSFNHKHILVRHVQSVHIGVRYNCEQCSKSFATKCYLADHTKIVHLGKRHSCKKCKKCYTTKARLNKHMKASHERTE